MFTIDIMFEDFNKCLEAELLSNIAINMELYFGILERSYESFSRRLNYEIDKETLVSTYLEDSYNIMLKESNYLWIPVNESLHVEKLIKYFGSIYSGVATKGHVVDYEVRFRIYDHIFYKDDEYRMLSIDIRNENIKNEFLKYLKNLQNDDIVAILER